MGNSGPGTWTWGCFWGFWVSILVIRVGFGAHYTILIQNSIGKHLAGLNREREVFGCDGTVWGLRAEAGFWV